MYPSSYFPQQLTIKNVVQTNSHNTLLANSFLRANFLPQLLHNVEHQFRLSAVLHHKAIIRKTMLLSSGRFSEAKEEDSRRDQIATA
ncbi:hypothetical protein L596_030711 [Steinernema carpocapsae]|uniref:Uncharacterized protein n=1 Tax=Steinernema carpocapsae TaxID=34508 RepID=A0A4V5ZWU9_STECR|nr:hypothetical protein L596_030711 [Steinernema carpocapsae]